MAIIDIFTMIIDIFAMIIDIFAMIKVACRNSTGQCRNVEIKTCRNAEMPK